MKTETEVRVSHTTDLATFIWILIAFFVVIAFAGYTANDVIDHMIDRLEALR